MKGYRDNMEKESRYVYRLISNYTMKVRIYPGKEQREVIDSYLVGLEKAANMTLWGLKEHDPMIVKESKGALWPDFYGMSRADGWMAYLRENNALVAALPGAALSSSVGGLFHHNMKKAWEKQGKLPVDKWFEATNKKGKPLVHWYGKSKRIESYYCQVLAGSFIKDGKRIFVKLPKIGLMRVRGWNDKIGFDETGNSTFFEAVDKKKAISCHVSKNNVGEYYITLTLQNVYRPFRVSDKEEEVGVNVALSKNHGVISTYSVDGGISSYENKEFKKQVEEKDRLYHQQLSRRRGVCNAEFRQELSAARKENKRLMKEGKEPNPLPEPSKRYQKTDMKQKKLSIKVARKRALYQHEISANEVSHASFMAVRSMNVKGMLKDDQKSAALSDAALSQQLQMLEYKANWKGIPVGKAGDIETGCCPDCGAETKVDFSSGWTCGECGAAFAPYESYAKAILNKAKENHSKGIDPDKVKKKKDKPDITPVSVKIPDAFVFFSEGMQNAKKNPWIVVSGDGKILDDAQGYGYSTRQNAQKAYRYKVKQASV